MQSTAAGIAAGYTESVAKRTKARNPNGESAYDAFERDVNARESRGELTEDQADGLVVMHRRKLYGLKGRPFEEFLRERGYAVDRNTKPRR